MKKLVALTIAGLFLLSGCAITSSQKEDRVITFMTEQGSYVLKADSKDFEDGTLFAPDGKSYKVKNAVTASGMRMVGDGAEVHFKKSDGIITIDGKDYPVKDIVY